jgi:deoxyadenosine/deoxycytidine kinase
MNSLNFEIISIEGNIGSGKSTLMENLKNYYKDDSHIIFLKEPVDEWEKIKDKNGKTILEKFYENQEKYSFSFQMMAYISRLNILRDSFKFIDIHSEKKYIIITERSLFTDKCVFAKMLYECDKMEDVNYQIYLSWFNTFIEEFPINKLIYVKALPEICYNRISKRSREGEQNISLEYLILCNKYHDDMIEYFEQNNIINNECQLLLDGNMDIYQNITQMNDWIEIIDSFIK